MQLTLGANCSPVNHRAGRLWAEATCFLSTWKPRKHTSCLVPTLFPRNALECVSGNPFTSLHQSGVKEAISEFLLSVFLSNRFQRTDDHRKPHKDSRWVCTPASVTLAESIICLPTPLGMGALPHFHASLPPCSFPSSKPPLKPQASSCSSTTGQPTQRVTNRTDRWGLGGPGSSVPHGEECVLLSRERLLFGGGEGGVRDLLS